MGRVVGLSGYQSSEDMERYVFRAYSFPFSGLISTEEVWTEDTSVETRPLDPTVFSQRTGKGPGLVKKSRWNQPPFFLLPPELETFVSFGNKDNQDGIHLWGSVGLGSLTGTPLTFRV